MNVFVITFEAEVEESRQKVIQAIASFGSWIELSDQCCALRTVATHDQIAAELSRHACGRQVHVLAIGKPWNAIGLEKISDWLGRD